MKELTNISLPRSGDQLTRHYTSSWFLSPKVTKKNQPSQHWVLQLHTRIKTEIFWPEILSVVARRPHFGTDIETVFRATWSVTQTKQILLVFVGDVPNLGPNNTFCDSIWDLSLGTHCSSQKFRIWGVSTKFVPKVRNVNIVWFLCEPCSCDGYKL